MPRRNLKRAESGHDAEIATARAAYEATHDMTAVRDAHALTDRLHAMIWDEEARPCVGNHSPHFARLSIDVPREWLIMAAWLDLRGDLRKRKLQVAFQDTIGEELSEHHLKRAADFLWWQMNNCFHEDLHWLATGAHPILEKPRPKPDDTAKVNNDLDDDIPF